MTIEPRRIASVLILTLGCLLTAVGLELFLVPNRVATGGLTGFSIVVSHMTEMKLSLILFLINLPLLARQLIRRLRRPAVAVIPVVLIGIFAYVLHPVPALVDEPFLAALGGGVCLGIGLGMVLRQGGTYGKAAEAVRLLPAFRSFDIGIVLFWTNLAVLALAGVVFGWEQAVYSILAHALAYAMLEAGYTGFSPIKVLRVRSRRLEQLQDAAETGGLRVSWLDVDDESATCAVHRGDAAKAKRLFRAVDDEVEIAAIYEEAQHEMHL